MPTLRTPSLAALFFVAIFVAITFLFTLAYFHDGVILVFSIAGYLDIQVR